MKISRGKVPPNGWHFQVTPEVKLESINEEGLIKLIFEFRLRNNLPIGNIERDLDEYYCSRWPEACHKEAKDWIPGADEATYSEPMLNRVSRWVATLMHKQPKGGYPLVNAEEAERRGKICVGCPKNQAWRVGCRGCSSSTATVLAQLRKTQTSQYHGELSGCEIGGWDNQTAVWIPAEDLTVSDAQRQTMPDRCWKKSQ